MHRRLGRPLLTAAGLAFTLVGAIGAALLASAGPWLLGAAASGELPTAAARSAFATLENVGGLWGSLGQFLLGAWLIGISWVIRTETRAFAYVGGGAGLGAVGYAIRTGAAGQPPLPVTGPLDLAILGTNEGTADSAATKKPPIHAQNQGWTAKSGTAYRIPDETSHASQPLTPVHQRDT